MRSLAILGSIRCNSCEGRLSLVIGGSVPATFLTSTQPHLTVHIFIPPRKVSDSSRPSANPSPLALPDPGKHADTMEETLEQLQSRHRKEQRDLQSRVTSKKKNATKKTRKGVNDECAELERLLKQRQRDELLLLRSLDDGEAAPPDADAPAEDDEDGDEPDDAPADGIADKLRSTTLTDPAPPNRTGPSASSSPTPSSPTSPATSQHAPQKKRNRQKERLARRAAEAEAAAAAASAEAAGMEDRRGNEGAHMRGEFRRMGLSEREVLPDGHCLFSAVADQLGQVGVALSSAAAGGAGEEEKQPPPYRVVRRVAAAYMEAHADDFAGFVEGEGLGSYVERIRDTAEWGGQLELVALAGAYGVDIHVLQDGSTEVITPNGADGEGEGERKKIWLAYYRHGYGLGEHYNSLRKTAPAT